MEEFYFFDLSRIKQINNSFKFIIQSFSNTNINIDIWLKYDIEKILSNFVITIPLFKRKSKIHEILYKYISLTITKFLSENLNLNISIIEKVNKVFIISIQFETSRVKELFYLLSKLKVSTFESNYRILAQNIAKTQRELTNVHFDLVEDDKNVEMILKYDRTFNDVIIYELTNYAKIYISLIPNNFIIFIEREILNNPSLDYYLHRNIYKLEEMISNQFPTMEEEEIFLPYGWLTIDKYDFLEEIGIKTENKIFHYTKIPLTELKELLNILNDYVFY